MGRYRWAPEYDSSGYQPVGQTRIDDETGDQEHFDTDRMTLKGRSVSDGHGHLTHLDEDGVGCRGHSDRDGDHTVHKGRDNLSTLGHTDHHSDGDVHTGLDRLSPRGFTGGGGGSAGFHEFHGDDDEQDDESDSASPGHEDEDESDKYDDESGSTGCVPMSEEEAARAVQYGKDILERVRRKDEAAQERLRAQFEHIRRNYFDPNAPKEVAEEPAEPAPRRRRSPSRRRPQPCNGDTLGWALCAVLGVAIVAGTTLALVFGLRNRHETSSEVPLGSTTEATPEKSLEDKLDDINNDLNEGIRLLQQRRYGTPETPVAAPQYVAPPPIVPEPDNATDTFETFKRKVTEMTTNYRDGSLCRVASFDRLGNGSLSAVIECRATSDHPIRRMSMQMKPEEVSMASGWKEESDALEAIESYRSAYGLKSSNPAPRTSNPANPSYEGPKWRPRMEPKRESQHVPQAMPNWARQRR